MAKHLADHRGDRTTGRMTQFLRIARGQSTTVWQRLSQAYPDTGDSRRLVEFLRIARQQPDRG